eukprot:UN28331
MIENHLQSYRFLFCSFRIFWRCWFDLAFALVFVAQYVEGENVRDACHTYTPLLFSLCLGPYATSEERLSTFISPFEIPSTTLRAI